jgi:hypothetical protein
MIRSLRIAAVILAMLAGLLPGYLTASWYTRAYYQRTGYLPFPFGPCGFALHAAQEAEAFPYWDNDSTEDSQ